MTKPVAVSFATGDPCDTLKNDDSGAFRVLPPVFRDFGGLQIFSGQGVTVKCFEDNSLVKAAVDSPGEGRVLVVDGGALLRRALLGGNLGETPAGSAWYRCADSGPVDRSGRLAVCR